MLQTSCLRSCNTLLSHTLKAHSCKILHKHTPSSILVVQGYNQHCQATLKELVWMLKSVLTNNLEEVRKVSCGSKWSALCTPGIEHHPKLLVTKRITCHTNNSLENCGMTQHKLNNIQFGRCSWMLSWWHFHILCIATLKWSKPGKCNIHDTPTALIFCISSTTDTISVAYRLLTFVSVNVSNNELKLITISTVLKSNTVAGEKKIFLSTSSHKSQLQISH